jgi:T5orf172 domain
VSFFELIRQILRTHPEGMTPQQLRDRIKADHPEYYGTESHRRNVEKGHYKDLDHALLAQIYVAARSASNISVDESQKPIKLTAMPGPVDDGSVIDEELDTEDLEKLEAGVGTMYVLGTNLYTKDGKEIIKIGITTGSVDARINQLYTTGVPFRFRVIKELETKNYYELEQALHKLLDPYRINRSREFFTDGCLDYIEQIVAIHQGIQSKA